MAGKSLKGRRCAIYTRKSTEQGLELEFNSLDAQREACEAYIKSQASEGWRVVSNRYDDPAYSGGNIDRPALQKLLKDIEAGHVDVIVVYKIDRLTRSLADFAKLVEVFDAKSVSFVAVTQQFNTTTSMGRLTLNVLLSFAQFERELASERVRDKVAASRKKGKWTGGNVPLGYDNKDKKLVINMVEAKTVQVIFNRYLALKSLQLVLDELNRKGVRTKARKFKGKAFGGIPFTYGPLAYLLKNRIYLGETGHAGSWFPGEHKPIIDRDLFDNVQQLLRANSEGRRGRRYQNGSLLTGLIFDDCGNRMSPSFSVKGGVRYRYYVSSALLRGRKSGVGSSPRISAPFVEAAVARAVTAECDDLCSDGNRSVEGSIEEMVDRVVVLNDRIILRLKTDASPIVLPRSSSENRDLSLIEHDAAVDSGRRPNPREVKAVVRAYVWLKALSDGTFDSVESLAQATGFHPRHVRNNIRLAFLAPDIVTEVLRGSASKRLGLHKREVAVPIGWLGQLQAFRPTGHN